MSVDKFGRYLHHMTVKEHVGKAEGFPLTATGDYDFANKRIKFAKDPIDDLDVVNFTTLKRYSLPIQDDTVNAQMKRFVNVKDPISKADAATKHYVDNTNPFTKIPGKMSYSIGQNNITDLAYPVDEKDAVNVKFVQDLCLVYGEHIDARDKLVVNVNTPINDKDAANKLYVDQKPPNIPLTTNGYYFYHTRIHGVGDPVLPTDAVSLKYLKSNVLCKKGNIFEGSKLVISNIAQPVQIDDAVSKRYLKEVLGDLGFTIYSKIRKSRTNMSVESEWKAKVLESSWSELFEA